MNLSDQLSAQIIEQITDLANAHRDEIAAKLTGSDDAKMSVGFTCKLQLGEGKLYTSTKMSFTTKFMDEVETAVDFDDPERPVLPLGEAVQSCKKPARN